MSYLLTICIKNSYEKRIVFQGLLLLLLLLLLLFTPLEFFTSALADGLSLEFERQQVSSCLQDTSQYSGRSQKYCHLEGLHSAANFQVF